MPGYYPMMSREPVPMAQVYPPARSYSLAKLNQAVPRDYGQYERVKVEKGSNGDRRPHRLFEGLRRQQSYDSDHIRAMYQNQSRRPEGFNSLQLLGANDDVRYLDRFMDSNRARPQTKEHMDNPKHKDTAKSNKSKSNNSNSSKGNKENSVTVSGNSEILAFIGSLKTAASVDNIYESVEQIHYRKTMESLNRREKVRSVQKTGHPLFDRLREERALAGGNDNNETYTTLNSSNKRTSRSAAPSRKTSAHSSPVHSSNSSSDEQENTQRSRRVSVPAYVQQAPPQQPQRKQQPAPSNHMRWGRPGSAGSESDEEWVIPRPKFINRRREVRTSSTDESDSSTKSSPMR